MSLTPPRFIHATYRDGTAPETTPVEVTICEPEYRVVIDACPDLDFSISELQRLELLAGKAITLPDPDYPFREHTIQLRG